MFVVEDNERSAIPIKVFAAYQITNGERLIFSILYPRINRALHKRLNQFLFGIGNTANVAKV